MNVHIRPIKSIDLDALLEIEKVSFPEPWELEDFKSTLNDNKNVGLLVETHGRLFGYLIYRLEQGQFNIISMAVAPDVRRKGIGRLMFEQVVLKLNPLKRTQICATASERSLDTHLFFKALGFKGVEVLRDFYGRGHDGYDFVHNIGTPYKYNENKRLDEACQGK
jgi:ribosomal-protein-alanine N-acetyltransferase